MRDPFSIFIGESVYLTKIEYTKIMNKTKILFFESLNDNITPETFKNELYKIWGNIDHSYMTQRIEELSKMVDSYNIDDHKVMNPNAVFEEVFKMDGLGIYTKTELKFARNISGYYKNKYNVIQNDYIDNISYLSKLVKNYDNYANSVPYYNKDGTIHSYHSIASYNSMLFNTNLTKSAWNRTIYDSKLLKNDLTYLPAHPFACPLCIPYQGKIYSVSGKNKDYPSKDEAIDGGVGHPNCKHVWLIYWNQSQLQDDKYNSEEWNYKYETQQKIYALDLEKSKLRTDIAIYKSLGNEEEADKTRIRVNNINATERELKSSLK